MTAVDAAPDAFARVVGQPTVVEHLRSAAQAPVHAYLFVGPAGSGKRALARAFAAELLAAVAAPEERARIVELVVQGRHPDVVEVDPEGGDVRDDEARLMLAAAMKSPVEGARKVVLGSGFERMTAKAAGTLLKPIEEPSPSTVFMALAEDVPAELVTIASRCLRVDVPPLAWSAIVAALVDDGVTPERAESVATAAGGDLERARVLADDERLELRRQAWVAVPAQLDGTGAMAYRLVAELTSMIDEAMAPLLAQQAAEIEAFDADREAYGLTKGARSQLEKAHRRQQRRFRTGELRFGLTLLNDVYRRQLVEGPALQPALRALDALAAMAEALRFNPNERLQLQALFLRLPPLR